MRWMMLVLVALVGLSACDKRIKEARVVERDRELASSR